MATYRGSSIQRWFLEASRTKCCMRSDQPPISSFVAEKAEAKDYLAEKIKKVERDGWRNVSSVVDLGYGAEEITLSPEKRLTIS